jgi:hypothetical protein
MNDSHSYITLDFRNTHMPVVVKAKRGDTARTLYISLADGGTPYQIAEGCTATFTAKKPDKTVIHNSCTIEGNMIVYPFTEQTCSAAGRVNADIRLYGSNGRMLTSASFTLEVSKTVVNPGDIPASESEMNALEALILDTTALKHEIEQKLENGDFVGPPGPAPVRGIDYWTEEDQQQILSEAQVLTDAEIEMLDYLLMNGAPICSPKLTATYKVTSSTSPTTYVTTYRCKVDVAINSIAKSLIQKVEVATLLAGNPPSPTNPNLEWKEATVTFGDIDHSASFSTSSTNGGSWQYGMGVKLTYYDVFGETHELYARAVSS